MAKTIGYSIWIPEHKDEPAIGNIWVDQIYSKVKKEVQKSYSSTSLAKEILVKEGLVEW